MTLNSEGRQNTRWHHSQRRSLLFWFSLISVNGVYCACAGSAAADRVLVTCRLSTTRRLVDYWRGQ